MNGQLMPFLDLSSAFYVEGAALNCFYSYLTERSQTFSIGNSKSNPHSVSCSVPQGSVLGPLEFVAYTEDVVDLFDQHKVNHHMYADDQHIYLHTEPGLASTASMHLAGYLILRSCF